MLYMDHLLGQVMNIINQQEISVPPHPLLAGNMDNNFIIWQLYRTFGTPSICSEL